MEHKQRLETLNKESLEKFEEWVKSRGVMNDEHYESIQKARDEWQVAWNKFMETLIVLERLEL